MENQDSRYEILKREIFRIAEKELSKLPKKLEYHNTDHYEDVISAASRIAVSEGIESRNKEYNLLKTAALLHDVGLLFTYNNHEERGGLFAKSILPTYEYSSEEIETIYGMILSTKMPQNPETGLQKIICDADLDNLGRKDFFEKGELLRKELENYGIKMSDEQWYTNTFNLIKNHSYHTNSQRELRDEGKKRNINSLIKILDSLKISVR